MDAVKRQQLARTVITEDGQQVDLQVSETGRVLLCIDGEPFAFTGHDAARIGVFMSQLGFALRKEPLPKKTNGVVVGERSTARSSLDHNCTGADCTVTGCASRAISDALKKEGT
jgi:hypothetical protein